VNPNNGCQICNPNQNASGFTNNVAALCGSLASVCSGQDTCNAQGQCAQNHFAAGTPCGNPPSGQCDAADTCNGGGQCTNQLAAAGTPCNDGQFCTDDDNCQMGQCSSGGGLDCGANARCDETADACVAILAGLGEACNTTSDCAAGRQCTVSFIDSDGDGFGFGAAIRACGTPDPNVLSPGESFVATGGDCCDAGPNANLAFPGQERYFNVATACGDFDYNCDGDDTVVSPTSCNGPASAPCEERFIAVLFGGPPFSQNNPCGANTGFTAPFFPCEIRDGVCTQDANVNLGYFCQ
jgi:hypothetical protein